MKSEDLNVTCEREILEQQEKEQRIAEAFHTFLDGVREIHKTYWTRMKFTHEAPTFEYTVGRKYFKIVRVDNQVSVHCFVNVENGDVLKAASWNAPAKHARGNILNPDNGLGCMTPFGADYLR